MNLLRNKKFKIAISLIFTVIVIVLLIKIIDFKSFIESIKQLNFAMLLVAFASLFVSYFFRVWRFQIALGSKKWITLFSISTLHYLFNRILPARTGEISLPILFNRHLGYSYQKGIGALLLFRLFDFWAMIFLFLLSIIFVHDVKIEYNYLLIIAIVGLSFLGSIWLFINFFTSILLQIISLIKIKKLNKLKTKIEEFGEQVKAYRKQKGILFFFKIVFSSIMSWVCIYLYYFFIIRAFGFEYGFFDVLFASTISNFTFILPISAVGNLGTFEAGWAMGFFLIGMANDVSIPVGLFSNIYATIITAFLALIGYILIKSQKKRQ